MENPKVEAIIGQHVHAELPLGTVRLRKGANSAGSDRFSAGRDAGKKHHDQNDWEDSF